MASKRIGSMHAKPVNWNMVSKWDYSIDMPKLNGFKCRIVADGHNVRLFTSQMNQFTCSPHIKNYIEWAIKKGKLPSVFELDGELYHHGMPLNEISSRVKRKNGIHSDFESIQYHCYDAIQSETQNQKARLEWRDHLINPILKDGLFYSVKATISDSINTSQDNLRQYMDDAYEGIIIRNPRGFYERKKSSAIFKYKPRHIDEYPIIGVKEAIDKNGNPKDELGSFLCLKDNEAFSVGTGPALKAWDRVIYWMERWKYMDDPGKYLAVIKYPELTGARAVPEHPVLVEVKENPEGEESS